MSRGSTGSLPVPAHFTGLVVGRPSYGLQAAMDAHPLRHLQLLAGELIDLFIHLFPYLFMYFFIHLTNHPVQLYLAWVTSLFTRR